MNNTFKFKYSALVWVLLACVLALSLVGLIWNAYNLIYFINSSVDKITSYSLIVLAIGALFVIALGVVFFGRYTVKNGVFCMHLGFFATKYSTDEITEIVHFKKSDKLVVYFSDQKYMVVMIANENYDNFVLALRNQNPKIAYNSMIDGEDTPI